MRAIAMAWVTLAATAFADEAKVDQKQESKSDSHSSSSVSVSSQKSQDGKTTTKSAKRTLEDGKVVEEEGDLALLDGLLKGGASVDDLERMVRELAKLDAAGAKAGGDARTRKYVKVVKDGKVIEESGDPSLLRDLGLAEMRKLGLEVEGLEGLVDGLVREALDAAKTGRAPAGSGTRKGVKVNGVPVDARVDWKGGADAMKELEKRCPELKGDLERQLRRVDGEFRSRLERARAAEKAPRPAPRTRAVR